MRLLERRDNDEFSLTKDLVGNIPAYAILSHTWGDDDQEVSFKDFTEGSGKSKAGYQKIRFCGEQAARDGYRYIWVDTCCIDKSNNAELSEALNSMYRWYRNAAKCYVYLVDVSTNDQNPTKGPSQSGDEAFQKSRWFTRGWTLQELIAPQSVEFFSFEGKLLGDKRSLEGQIHEITGITVSALQGTPPSEFSVKERFSWAANRETTKEEDKAYSLLGIFDVFLPLIYGEGRENAFRRLQEEVDRSVKSHEVYKLPRSGVEDQPVLTFPVRKMIEQDADYNLLSYDDSGRITLKMPYFDKSALAASSSFPAPKCITRGNSAFELAEVLQLLPGQSNTARWKLQELDLRTLVYDEISYYCRISLEPLIRLIIDHFTSVRAENNTLITRTKVGTFTFSRTTLGQIVRFSGRDRATSSVSSPEQLFDAVKKCASGQFQRRKGAGLAFHEDYSHIPLIWESMKLEEAFIYTDLEEPNCIRFMTKEDYDEMQFQKNYASVVLENFVSVTEARAEDFAALGKDLDIIMILKDCSITKASEMKIVASGVAFAISAAWKANGQPEVPLPEQHDSIYPWADRIHSQQYNRSRHIYSQQMSAFRRNRDEAANLEALIAIAEQNLSWAIWQACFASLAKANFNIILVNAVVAPQQWIDLVIMPDVDILMA